MKREEFLITSTQGHNVVKYKWNSANREAQNLMQEWANEYPDNTVWNLVESTSEKDGKFHVSGVRVWKGTNGKEISFFITKIA